MKDQVSHPYKTKPFMVHFMQCVLIIIGISADDILLHENWYQRYEILKAKQKQAIQEWRALRDKSSQQNGTNSESVQLHQRSKVENCEESAEKKQKIEAWKVIYLILCPGMKRDFIFDIVVHSLVNFIRLSICTFSVHSARFENFFLIY
jgi:thymidylate synthase ThyX